MILTNNSERECMIDLLENKKTYDNRKKKPLFITTTQKFMHEWIES